MSFENPTPLRVGATGILNGWRVRVAGRVVMGMELEGETYYWNEYCLVDDSGNSATLVYEEGDNGPEWKLFRAFEPAHPMSAGEAAQKRVGDSVNLDGSPMPITLVDQSRVYHIEGNAPDGVGVGDVADYFNVDTGERMLVASWTGDEIEFYEGLDVPSAGVVSAFNLPRTEPTRPTISALTSSLRPAVATGKSKLFSGLVLCLLAGLTAFGAYSCYRGRSSVAGVPAPRPKTAASPLRLPNGAKGSLGPHTYTVTSHLLVEIGRITGRHDRHEYGVTDETAAPAVLVNGLSGSAKEWHLFQAVAPSPALSPYDAAALRKGLPVDVGGRAFRVADLFVAKLVSADGPSVATPAPGATQYGLIAVESGEWLMARWTDRQIEFYRGTALDEPQVIAALMPRSGKAK